jgi:hypothetical protein
LRRLRLDWRQAIDVYLRDDAHRHSVPAKVLSHTIGGYLVMV